MGSRQLESYLNDLQSELASRGIVQVRISQEVRDHLLDEYTLASLDQLDAFVDHLAGGTPVILADMGSGSGQVTYEWFENMYPDVADAGILFTTIGVVTADPASVESVLAWAARLQNRVEYLIVENSITDHADFTYWRESDQARQFREAFSPAVIQMDYRLAELENAIRNHGVTLGGVAAKTTDVAELRKASLVMRAQSYRRRMFAEFDKIKELLLP